MRKKQLNVKCHGKGIFLRPLQADDATEDYRNWMNNRNVTRFLECRWLKFTIKDLRAFINSINKSQNDFLFGIFLNENSRHIGNIKIGNVNARHKFAEVGLLIGDRSQWGKGYATEAIKLATEYAFSVLRLNKIVAGIYANNTGSFRAFQKAGYRKIGIMKKHRVSSGVLVDEILVEKLRPRAIARAGKIC